MCGIIGILDKNLAKRELVEKMTQVIAYRGPDDAGYFVDDSVALGMRRLSIIDLERGKQPISSADGRYQIFFNGEIYNYKEIKKELTTYNFTTDSDTEVVLAGYVKWGSHVCEHLRGMFAFCIYDKEEKKIFLARDFFGIKPLYYLVAAGFQNSTSSPASGGLRRSSNLDNSAPVITAFSSEIKSFLQLPGFKPEVNDAAVYNCLSYQYNPLEETFFRNVYKLPPAYFMTVDLATGKFEKKRYWQFKFRPDESLDEGETEKKILETMKDSVEHHMIADVPVGSFLSGGIDSSIIATLMSSSAKASAGQSKKIKTFTVTFGDVSEGVEAKETSGPLGTDHKEISVGAEEYFEALPKVVWHFDEPVADPSALGIYFLSREASKEVKVVLSGEGADELFGGYNIYLAPLATRWISWLPRIVLYLLSSLPLRGRNYAERALSRVEDWYIGNASVFKRDEVEKLWLGEDMSKTIFDIKSIYARTVGLSDSTKMQYIDMHTWLVGDILAKADKMTMAHSLELRVPFLDKKVSDLARTLPDRFKWRGEVTKHILREAFENVLPESTRRRKKLGFPVPIGKWIDREDVRNTILENDYVKAHLNIDIVEKLFENCQDNARKIYLLLMLATWYNVFVKHA